MNRATSRFTLRAASKCNNNILNMVIEGMIYVKLWNVGPAMVELSECNVATPTICFSFLFFYNERSRSLFDSIMNAVFEHHFWGAFLVRILLQFRFEAVEAVDKNLYIMVDEDRGVLATANLVTIFEEAAGSHAWLGRGMAGRRNGMQTAYPFLMYSIFCIIFVCWPSSSLNAINSGIFFRTSF